MIEILQKEMNVTPSYADFSGAMSYYGVFSTFMDIASIHAELLGVGFKEMNSRDMFWLTVKTKACFTRRPKLGEKITVRTWPEVPEKVRCVRSYEISQNDEVLITGKTEWAVINTKTHGIVPLRDVFPKDLAFPTVSACQEPFARLPNAFEEPPITEYRVVSTDIDIGGHMNNAVYVRALASTFSNEELAEKCIKGIDIIYKTPCYEKDLLSVQRKQTEEGLLTRFSKEGETVMLARMTYDIN